jgi:hypothetical protein
MGKISYHSHSNLHTLDGARRGLERMLVGREVSSLLDVGAGVGTWLAAARDLGVRDIAGIDGVRSDAVDLHVDADIIATADLNDVVFLGRRFDAVLCLEVAEHLDEASAPALIETLCRHSNLIFFSAAAPGQHGEHHVNCRWPTYWQAYFNTFGFVCRDELRASIWDDGAIEPWYRQNAFVAHFDPEAAGTEPRIRHMIHPEMTQHMDFPDSPLARKQFNLSIGVYSPYYYLRLLNRSLLRRVGAPVLAD